MTTKLLKVDHRLQTTDYTCGPAAILSFLDYHDKKIANQLTEKKLAALLKTCPHVGTSTSQMHQLLKQTNENFCLLRNAKQADLLTSINAELPSLVLWHDDTEWHWSTVIGYNEKNIILLDPYLEGEFNQVCKNKFEKVWSKIAIR